MIGVGALVVRAREKLPAEGAAQVAAPWERLSHHGGTESTEEYTEERL
jgi:hypothetical protein